MSIFVDSNTRLLVQGITGKAGSFHTEQMLNYGTNIVAGVTPGKEGEVFLHKVPIFDSVNKAVKQTKANTSIIYVPASFAADAILEAADAGIELIICITEGIPTLDMLMVKQALKNYKTRLIGPNCPGIITPDVCKIGIMPGFIHKKGNVGVVSRSGTLTYEAVYQLTQLGIGQSSCIGIGGDPIIGTSFIDVLQAFNDDPQTEAIVLIGEIGGNEEEKAALFAKSNIKKPIVGFIAGQSAPLGKRMGHAGAIISSGQGLAKDKISAFEKANIRVAITTNEIGLKVKEALCL